MCLTDSIVEKIDWRLMRQPMSSVGLYMDFVGIHYVEVDWY